MAGNKKPGAHQSRAHHERAQSAYDEILQEEGAPAADLKSLIAGVKAATQRKTQTQKRISKKAAVQKKQLLSREQRTLAIREQALDEEFKREQARAAIEEQRVKDLRTDTMLAVRDDPKRDKHYDLGVEFTRIYSELQEVLSAKEAMLVLLTPHDLIVLESMWRDLNVTARQVVQLSMTLFSDETVQDEEQKFKELLAKIQPRLRRIQEAVAQNRRLTGPTQNLPAVVQPSSRTGSAYVPRGAAASPGVSDANIVNASGGGRLMRLMGMFGRGVANLTATGANAMWNGGKVMSNRMVGLATKSVAVVASAGKSIANLGEQIKGVKDTGAEWMKKVGDLFGYIRRKWASLQSGAKSGAGMLGTLIGLGMLFDSLIKPIFQQLNKELENRFGEHYVRDFMNNMWDKAKTWMMDGIKGIFLASPQQQKSMVDTQKAAQAVVSGQVAQKAGEAGIGGKVWDIVKHGSDSNEVLADVLGEYLAQGTSPARKSFDKIYINNILKNRISKKWPLPVSLAAQLKGAGFNVDAVPTVLDGAKSQGALPAAAAVGAARTFSMPGAKINTAPIQLNTKPVVAAVPPRQVSAPPKAKPASRGGVAPGSGNHAIPNQGVSDLFEALNSGVLGGGVP